jgi:ABC-type glutathione transport system ATPase component
MSLAALLDESARLHRPEANARHERQRALDEVGLGGRGEAYPHELSGGELRRAGVARLLLARPRLVVADEPTAGLDAALKASLVELLLERLGPRCAFVLISHDLPVVAWACDRMLVMKGGRIVDRFETAPLRRGATDVGPAERDPVTERLLAAAGMVGAGAEHLRGKA